MATRQLCSRGQEPVKTFIKRWLINTLAVLVAAYVVKGIHYDTVEALFVASLLLGILNTFIRPVIMLLSLPLLLFTLGLFMLFINAAMLYFVGQVVKAFHVDSFWAAFWGALLISIVSSLINVLTGTEKASIRVSRGRRPNQGTNQDKGGGPVIDV